VDVGGLLLGGEGLPLGAEGGLGAGLEDGVVFAGEAGGGGAVDKAGGGLGVEHAGGGDDDAGGDEDEGDGHACGHVEYGEAFEFFCPAAGEDGVGQEEGHVDADGGGG